MCKTAAKREQSRGVGQLWAAGLEQQDRTIAQGYQAVVRSGHGAAALCGCSVTQQAGARLCCKDAALLQLLLRMHIRPHVPAGSRSLLPAALRLQTRVYRVRGCSVHSLLLGASQVTLATRRAVSAARRKLSLSRKLPCSKCNGTGSKSGKRHTCSTCHGSGVQVHIRPLGPGMVQQIQSRCGDCSGSGYSSIPSEHPGDGLRT
jgi:hypothetical protein